MKILYLPQQYFSYLALIVLFLFLNACASVSIDTMRPGKTTPLQLPERIYVERFSAPVLHFHVNRKGSELHTLIEEERQRFAEELVQRLNKNIAPTVLLAKGEEPPHGNFWLVKGSFELVNEGSRMLRAGFGLGLGKTKMETTAQLVDLSEKSEELTLLTLTTTGGSGVAPGAALALTPIGPFVLSHFLVNAGGSLGGALGSGISIDRSRTVREIVAAISEYSNNHGLLSKKKTLHPKRLGKISTPF